MHYLYLAVAIVAEVAATASLKASESFTRLWPSVVVVGGYALAFYLLTLCVQTMKLGIVYAIWSGVGIVLVTLVAAAVYSQKMDLAGWAGIALIIAGVVVIQLFSQATIL